MKIRLFRHYVDAPIWILALLEGLILFGAVYAAAHLRFINSPNEALEVLGPLFTRATTISATMLFIMVILGLYDLSSKSTDLGYYSIYAASYFIGFVALTVIFYVIPALFLGRGVLGLSLIIGFVGVTSLRYLFINVLGGHAGERRVLVLGTGTRSAQIANLAATSRQTNRFSLVGFVPTGPEETPVERLRVVSTGSQAVALAEPEPIVPGKVPLLALVRQNEADEVVVGVRQRRGGQLNMQELLECRMEGINVIELSTFFERETGKVNLDSLNPSWMVFSEGFNRSNTRNTIKRIFDLAASSILFLISFPVLLLTIFLIKLDSRGPVLYRQIRVGECGQVFGVLKFRSMRVDAESEGTPQWAKLQDDRVTSIGRIIRKLRIDELPQIINVLKGDMSFVGPRPERPYFVDN